MCDKFVFLKQRQKVATCGMCNAMHKITWIEKTLFYDKVSIGRAHHKDGKAVISNPVCLDLATLTWMEEN